MAPARIDGAAGLLSLSPPPSTTQHLPRSPVPPSSHLSSHLTPARTHSAAAPGADDMSSPSPPTIYVDAFAVRPPLSPLLPR